MRTIGSLFVGLFLLMAAMTALVVSTALYMLVKLLPLLLVAVVVLAMVRMLRPRPTPSAKAVAPLRARALPVGSTRWRGMPGYAQPHQQPMWGQPGQPGWVLMPVWMGDVPAAAPRPRRDVIDAEVISTQDEHG